MKKILSVVAVVLAVAAYGSNLQTVHAQSGSDQAIITVSRADLEQELASLQAQLADLEIKAGMVRFQGDPASGNADTLGGDFAGGVTPSQLWTGNAAAGSVSPVLPNLALNGNITETNNAAVNYLLGTTLMGNSVFADGGWYPTITTSTTITASQFCGSTAVYVPASSPSGITETLPSASSSYAVCGGAPGAFSFQTVTNDSTSSILTNLGAGMIPRYGYNGSSTQPASSTFIYLGQWTSSSTMEIDIFQI